MMRVKVKERHEEYPEGFPLELRFGSKELFALEAGKRKEYFVKLNEWLGKNWNVVASYESHPVHD